MQTNIKMFAKFRIMDMIIQQIMKINYKLIRLLKKKGSVNRIRVPEINVYIIWTD